jgi:hypothetical protein
VAGAASTAGGVSSVAPSSKISRSALQAVTMSSMAQAQNAVDLNISNPRSGGESTPGDEQAASDHRRAKSQFPGVREPCPPGGGRTDDGAGFRGSRQADIHREVYPPALPTRWREPNRRETGDPPRDPIFGLGTGSFSHHEVATTGARRRGHVESVTLCGRFVVPEEKVADFPATGAVQSVNNSVVIVRLTPGQESLSIRSRSTGPPDAVLGVGGARRS